MHEMSLCEGIRGIVEDQARRHGFASVKVLRLEIGRFAGVALQEERACESQRLDFDPLLKQYAYCELAV